MVSASTGQAAAGFYRILLLAALPQEVRPFLRLSRARRRRGLPWPAWEFALDRVRGLLTLSGMGETTTREAATRLAAQFQPHLLISLGFGGALTPEVEAGDLVLGEYFGRYDPDLARLTPVEPLPASPRPLEELVQAMAGAGLPAFVGSLITTTYVIHKGRQGGGLPRLTRPVMDLESAVVAEAAAVVGLPFLGLRAVTDAAVEEIPEFLRPPGADVGTVGVLDALGWLAADPRRLAELIRLWRRSRLAAARLAAALMALVPRLS